MGENLKNKILVIAFIIIIIGGCFINIVVKDKTISVSERRKLKQFPTLTISKILNGNLSKELEDYAMDQFVGRDLFRNIKTNVHLYALRQQDTNGLFLKNGSIYKQTGLLNESAINYVTQKFNKIQEKYLKNCQVYYAIVPDKNYYLEDNYLKMDYQKLERLMTGNLKNMQYINLFSILNQTDYYQTDTHWKQEKIGKVAQKIGAQMNSSIDLKENKVLTKGNFYGVYYGQLGIKVNPDQLNYVTNTDIQNSSTYNYETKKQTKVYDEEKWKTSSDKYDLFVSGATPLITITNPNAKNEKELLLFRDSFGSSLAPLLLEGYSKITLIDIRYISSENLEQYITFSNQDVLFLYSTLVLNEYGILK